MVYTFTDFDKAKSKAKTKKNCKKGLSCGASCLRRRQPSGRFTQCKQPILGDGGGYADHITNPDNLEKGAESSGESVEVAKLSDTEKKALFDKLHKDVVLDTGIESLAKVINPDAPPPTDSQMDSIHNYTGSSYEPINAVLRGYSNASPEYAARYQAIADEAIAGMKEMPDYKGETYRGTNLSNSIIDKMEVGGRYTDKGFFSTTQDKAVASEFKEFGANNKETPVFFTIDGKRGKDVSAISATDGEKEVLFAPSTDFSITSMVKEGGVLYVKLKQ